MRVRHAVRRSGPGEHRQIVERVTEGDRLSGRDPLLGGEIGQHRGLRDPARGDLHQTVTAAVAGRHPLAHQRIRSSPSSSSECHARMPDEQLRGRLRKQFLHLGDQRVRPVSATDSGRPVPVRNGPIARWRTPRPESPRGSPAPPRVRPLDSIKRVRIALRRRTSYRMAPLATIATPCSPTRYVRSCSQRGGRAVTITKTLPACCAARTAARVRSRHGAVTAEKVPSRSVAIRRGFRGTVTG